MPRGDRTGPMGLGPTSGRAAGYCAEYGAPGFWNTGFWRGGMGRRGGLGGGRGWRNWFYATGLPGWLRFGWSGAYPATLRGSERDFLKGQAEQLRSELAAVEQRLNELTTPDKG